MSTLSDLGAGSEELQSQTAQLGDAQLSLLAREVLQRHTEPADGGRARAGQGQPPPALISAIRAQQIERARQLATEAHITPLELSLLATANAQPELGLAQAELLLDANPRDPGALIAGLQAASRLSGDEPLRLILHTAQGDQVPAPELARALGEVLRTRIDEEAARTWNQAYQRVPAPNSDGKR